jgi:hypothetical protein
MKKLTALAALLLCLGLTPPVNVLVTWSVPPAGPAGVALLDAGPQQSNWVNVANSPVVSIICVGLDAGTNAALGSLILVGSNDKVLQIPLATTLALPGMGYTDVGWDPVTTGMTYLAVQVDGGGTVAGAVQCSLTGKGGYYP